MVTTPHKRQTRMQKLLASRKLTDSDIGDLSTQEQAWLSSYQNLEQRLANRTLPTYSLEWEQKIVDMVDHRYHTCVPRNFSMLAKIAVMSLIIIVVILWHYRPPNSASRMQPVLSQEQWRSVLLEVSQEFLGECETFRRSVKLYPRPASDNANFIHLLKENMDDTLEKIYYFVQHYTYADKRKRNG